MSTKLKVNGRTVEVKSEADTPLLWVIRDEIGMTGTKFGCGAALCGACTVHIDGVPVRSCQTPLSAAAGKSVSTIDVYGAGAAQRCTAAEFSSCHTYFIADDPQQRGVCF